MAYGINFAIGPSCFVKCIGCYNHFGGTAAGAKGKDGKKAQLVTANEVLDFARAARGLGLAETTLSGGDPLTHPEIVKVTNGLKALGVRVSFDTVGTAMLRPADLKFYGQGQMSKVELKDVAQSIDVLGIPIDGPSDAVISKFRQRVGEGVLADSLEVIRLALSNDVSVTVNTVLHRGNARWLDELVEVVGNSGAQHWQIFEFQPTGRIASRNAQLFQLEDTEFGKLMERVPAKVGSVQKIEGKGRDAREGAYFLVNDAGMAWTPKPNAAEPNEIGHITADRQTVMRALETHLGHFAPQLSTRLWAPDMN